MSYLEVPSASIYYETFGSDRPLLLCISGADGSCDIWRGFAECLKTHFTVVLWDRRGFSRSHLTGPQDYDQRLETDAGDAAALIKHLSPNEPATVIGNSSGAIVSLKLLVRHPEIVRTVVPYEPPLASILEDFGELWKEHEATYALYRKGGAIPAFGRFAQLTKADMRGLASVMDPKKSIYIHSNIQYWFEREFMYYPKAPFDVNKELRPLSEKLMFVNGELSPKDAYQYRANVKMAKELGKGLVILPGEHVGHATCPKEFSAALLEALKAKDSFYADV